MKSALGREWGDIFATPSIKKDAVGHFYLTFYLITRSARASTLGGIA